MSMLRHKGNALFLILIAVALFAALSYAITQSSRGGGTIDKESAAIAASQITQYTADLRTAVQRMILSGGVSPASINYDPHCNNGVTCLFAPDGGGQTAHWCEATYQMVGVPGDDHNGHGSWIFRGTNGGSGGGADSGTHGFYIKDVGTNTDLTGRDAFVMLAEGGGTSLAVCQRINKELGISDWQTPADNSNFNIKDGGGVAAYNEAANVIYAYPGRPFACVNQGGGPRGYDGYDYYHALIEQ